MNSSEEVTVTIKGISPLMMHAFPMQPIEKLEKRPPEEQAELAAYRDPDTSNLYVPAEAVRQSLIAAAAYTKKQKLAAACVLVGPERLGLGVSTFEIDARPVVIPSTKGRIVRYRPRLEGWSITFTLVYDPSLLKETEVRRIVNDAGSLVGLLEFRPQRKGPYGRFMVTEWKNGK